jgi:hypothetical protein
MKRIVIIFLALSFILAACAAPAPTSTGEQPTAAPALPEPTQTAVVIVQTVVEKVVETVMVTVVPTQAPTEVPSITPLPPTEVPPTQAVLEATQPPVQAAAPADTTSGLIPVDDVLGAGWFVGMTRDRNDFALRCQLSREIAFSVKPADPNIAQVQLYYRIEDRATGAIFDWQNAGKMVQDGNGNFNIVFAGDSVSANFRKPNAWFDYQFVGLSKTGGVVGRSDKIVQQVSYTYDCP